MERSLLSEPAFKYLSESPLEEPSLQILLAVIQLRVTLSFQSPLCPSFKIPGECPFHLLWREVPTSRVFLYKFFRVPKNEPSLKVLLAELP
jgi:hypothetical protein